MTSYFKILGKMAQIRGLYLILAQQGGLWNLAIGQLCMLLRKIDLGSFHFSYVLLFNLDVFEIPLKYTSRMRLSLSFFYGGL